MNKATHTGTCTPVGEGRARSIRTYAEIFFVALLAALILKTFVVDAVYVPSRSMERTLFNGDYVLVNKLVYGAHSPKHLPFTQAEFPSIRLPKLKSIERRDVVVFELPAIGEEHRAQLPVYFVKR